MTAQSIDERGNGTLNLLGMMLKLAYCLRRHLWGAWSLAQWLGLLIAACAIVLAVRYWPSFSAAILLGSLLVAWIVFLRWAERKGYVHFQVDSGADMLLSQAPPRPPLRPEQRVPVQASGWFTVEGNEQYLVDVEADMKITGLGERIVMGRVHPSRFLMLGRWPAYELGWWYIFFFPVHVREISIGHLSFGPRSRVAIRLIYGLDGEPRQTIYLTSSEAWVLRLVRDDLERELSRIEREARARRSTLKGGEPCAAKSQEDHPQKRGRT